MEKKAKREVRLGAGGLRLADVAEAAAGRLVLEWEDAARSKAASSERLLRDKLSKGHRIYGVNTGFGEDGAREVDSSAMEKLQEEVIAYHGAGTGPVLEEDSSRAVLFTRAASLARGFSAVRPATVDMVIGLFNQGAAPYIPSLGSVGASGDLTPLSYLAAMLQGRRKAWLQGRVLPSAEVLAACGFQPWRPAAKEALALLNGTSVMTALAALGHQGLVRWAAWADAVTGWGAAALELQEEPFLDQVHELKGHPGSLKSARAIRAEGPLDTAPVGETRGRFTPGKNIQPRYSFRCSPQALGVLHDTLAFTADWLERELNSVNDNPLFDPEKGRAYHAGNFSGFHVSAASDALRNALALGVNLLDRQVQILLDGQQNNGLGPNLAEWNGKNPRFGLKALGIGLSALAAEVQYLAAPVLVLTRPTENGNQDVVSMGTVSARKLREAESLGWLAMAHAAAAAGTALRLRLGAAAPRKVLEILSVMEQQETFGEGLQTLAAILERSTPGAFPA